MAGDAGSVTVEQVAGTCTVVLHGEHDAFTSCLVREAIDRALDSCGEVVVDLNEADFIDSAVLGDLYDAYRRGRDAGVPLIVVSAPGSWPRRILDMVRFSSTVPVLDAR